MNQPDTLKTRLAAILAELAASPHDDRGALIDEAACDAVNACNGTEERQDLPGLAAELAMRLAEWQAADTEELRSHYEDEANEGQHSDDRARAVECRDYYAALSQAATDLGGLTRSAASLYRADVIRAEAL